MISERGGMVGVIGVGGGVISERGGMVGVIGVGCG